MNTIVKYISDVRKEMTHVTWPSRSQAITYTALVVGISTLVAGFAALVDLGALKFISLFTF